MVYVPVTASTGSLIKAASAFAKALRPKLSQKSNSLPNSALTSASSPVSTPVPTRVSTIFFGMPHSVSPSFPRMLFVTPLPTDPCSMPRPMSRAIPSGSIEPVSIRLFTMPDATLPPTCMPVFITPLSPCSPLSARPDTAPKAISRPIFVSS